MPLDAKLLFNDELYRDVILDKLVHARESVWIATANLKAMMVEQGGEFVPVVEVFSRPAKSVQDTQLPAAIAPVASDDA